MKSFLLFLFLACGFCVSAQLTVQRSWYKMLVGKIDWYPVVLHLHKTDHRFCGYYYYASKQQPVYFNGEDTTQQGAVTLTAFTGGERTETFRFVLSKDGAAGTWKQDENSKALSFTATETTASNGWTYVFTEGAARLRPNLKNSPEATYEAAAVWPTGTSAGDALLKKIIRQVLSVKASDDSEIGRVLLREKEAYFEEYRREFIDVKEADLNEMPAAYTMAVSNQLTIAYQSPKLLTLAFLNYAYTGGAHGNYGTTYSTIDLQNRRKLELNDVLTPQGQAALSRLLEQQFRAAYQLSTTDSLQEGGLFENHISPNNNFYVTGKGIGFNYVPYEIGPYVMGEITLFIPLKDVQPYLQPAFKVLLQ